MSDTEGMSVSPQFDRQVAGTSLLSKRVVENNLNVSRLNSGNLVVSIRRGQECLVYELTEEERVQLVEWLEKPSKSR